MSDTIMFDFSDYYDRVAELLPTGCRTAEIGIADGDSIIYLAEKLLYLNKGFKIYAVDNMSYGGFFQMKTIYQNLIKHKVGDYIEIFPYDSLTAASMFNDNFFDFVFIDSSHTYAETKKEIPIWYNKVIDMGYLSGHDWYATEVNQAVKETIPETITRNDIEGRRFAPEQFLNTYPTKNGYGVWECQKDFYKKLK